MPEGYRADLVALANALAAARALLTTKQRVFLDEYFASGMDGPLAAVAAGFDPSIARRTAANLLKLPAMLTAIEAVMNYHTAKSQMRVEELKEELFSIATSNIGDFFDTDSSGDMRLTLSPDTDRKKLAAIQSISISRTQTQFGQNENIKFSMHSKLAAIDTLLKMLHVKGVAEEAANPSVVNNNLSVTNIAIVPVPSGTFLPAPVVEHTPLARTPLIDHVTVAKDT
jgi:phage terminase small subunit